MNYNDLEQRYDAFVSHEKYAEIAKIAERNFHTAESHQKALELSNWEYNVYFLENYFDRPKSYGDVMSQTSNSWLILLSNRVIDLDTTQSPDFRDKEKYLDWLDKQINN